MRKYMKKVTSDEWRVASSSLRGASHCHCEEGEARRSNLKMGLLRHFVPRNDMGGILQILAMTFFPMFFYTLYAIRCPLSYAEDKPAATAVMQVANERLQAENVELKDKDAALQAELSRINLDREEVLKKLKIITEENTRLKDEISYFQTGIVNLDNERKRLEEANKKTIDQVMEVEKKLQPIRDLESEVRREKSEVRKWQDKAEKLENEKKKLEKENKESQIFIDKLQEKQKGLLKEKSEIKSSLSDTVSELADANKQLKRLKKEVGDMHYNLGVIFQQQAKWQEAVREYEKVLEVKPDDAQTHYNLALIYDTVRNDRQMALEHYQRYLNISPDANDAAKIKERITELGVENKVWGEPGAKNLKEKKGRW